MEMKGQPILKSEEEEAQEKTWDEGALQQWERETNEGKPWEGRVVNQ